MNKLFLLVVVLLVAPLKAPAIFLGQVDDFEDGTTMGWGEGGPSPNPPQNIANGGPLGFGDNYLENVSSGGFGPGSMMTMMNSAQWAGNYAAAGVTAIAAQMANFGANALAMRIALSGAGGSFSSTTAHALPADGQWYSFVFGLTADDLTAVDGGFSLPATLADVSQVRIISNAGGPSFRGESIAATLGVDNITAIPEPGTTVLVLMAAAFTCLRRRRLFASQS